MYNRWPRPGFFACSLSSHFGLSLCHYTVSYTRLFVIASSVWFDSPGLRSLCLTVPAFGLLIFTCPGTCLALSLWTALFPIGVLFVPFVCGLPCLRSSVLLVHRPMADCPWSNLHCWPSWHVLWPLVQFLNSAISLACLLDRPWMKLRCRPSLHVPWTLVQFLHFSACLVRLPACS